MNAKVTIDLDNYTNERLHMVVARIMGMPCCDSVFTRSSFSKGYHVIVWCKRANCDLCRLVFDDSNRFSMDILRRTEEQNVLWETARSLKGFPVKPGNGTL